MSERRELFARLGAWLSDVLGIRRAPPPVVPVRKLTPIEEVVARIGREPPVTD